MPAIKKNASGFQRRRGLLEAMGLNKKALRLREFARTRQIVFEELKSEGVPEKSMAGLVHQAGGMSVSIFVGQFD